MTRMRTITIAITRRTWMKPPSVYDVTIPRSHRTSRITKMVQSIFLPPLLRRATAVPGVEWIMLFATREDGHGSLFHEGLLTALRNARLLGRAPEAALRALCGLRQERERSPRRAGGVVAREAADAVVVGAQAPLRLGVEWDAAPRDVLWKSDKEPRESGKGCRPRRTDQTGLRFARGLGEGVSRDRKPPGNRLGRARLGRGRSPSLQRLARRA